MQFRNEKLFVKVGVTVNLSPGQPKINGRSQFLTMSQIFVKYVCFFAISS